MKTKTVVHVAMIAALYAVLTVALAPVSYGVIQFRFSEVLKVFCLFSPWGSIAIGIGTFFANLMSPQVGPWELVFMPITDIFGGLLAWLIFQSLLKKRVLYFIPMAIYSLTTAAAVAWMLQAMGFDLFAPAFLSVGISEAIIMVVGGPIILYVVKMLERRGITLFE